MSGTVVGLVDAFVNLPYNPPTGFATQERFIRTKLFFDRQIDVGNAELIATNFGTAGASNVGTGFDGWGGVNPAGQNAWFVVRMLATASSIRANDFYVLVQWADSETYGSNGGAPGLLNGLNNSGADGVGVALAYREDGGSPWNGTSNADGADTKGTPVWADGPSTAHLVSPTTTQGANLEDTCSVFNSTTSSKRLFILGDADTFFFSESYSNNVNTNTLYNFSVLGTFIPISGLMHPNPYFVAARAANITSTEFTSSASSYYGALMGVDQANEAQNFILCKPPEHFSLGAQPTVQGSFVKFTDFPVYMIQTSGTGSGLIGSIPTSILTTIHNIAAPTASLDGTRAFWAMYNSPAINLSTAWGGPYPPWTGSAREGRVF